MDEHQRKRVELILAHELGLARRAANQAAQAVYAEHGAKGRLGSGATVKVVLEAIGENVNGLLDRLIDIIGQFARNREAFAMIDAAMTNHFDDVNGEVQGAARMASGLGAKEVIPSIANAANERFAQIKTDMWARLEIEKFAFELDELVAAPTLASTAPWPKNSGGKPLARHWDDMWSSIAVKLWLGDLKPMSQADVKVAMLAWFTANEIVIGDTAVTERARQLWLKMEAAQ